MAVVGGCSKLIVRLLPVCGMVVTIGCNTVVSRL